MSAFERTLKQLLVSYRIVSYLTVELQPSVYRTARRCLCRVSWWPPPPAPGQPQQPLCWMRDHGKHQSMNTSPCCCRHPFHCRALRLSAANQRHRRRFIHRCKKRSLRFYFGHVFTFFNVFLNFPNVFLFLKKLAKFRTSRLTRRTIKITATK